STALLRGARAPRFRARPRTPPRERTRTRTRTRTPEPQSEMPSWGHSPNCLGSARAPLLSPAGGRQPLVFSGGVSSLLVCLCADHCAEHRAPLKAPIQLRRAAHLCTAVVSPAAGTAPAQWFRRTVARSERRRTMNQSPNRILLVATL